MGSDTVSGVLDPAWLSLVAIGLTAGLVTNAVAIWMLFHPYQPLRLGRLRVFPQGAIPQEIDRIARKIGETVGTHLLRPVDIAETLRQPEFRERFDQTLRTALESLFDKELGSLRAEIPEERLPEVRRTVSDLGDRLLTAVTEYLHSESFEDRVHEFVHRLTEEFADEPLDQVLTPAPRTELVSILRDLGRAAVESPGFRHAVDEFFGRHLRDFVRSDEPLGRYLPAGAVNFGEAIVQNYLPLVLDRFGQVLESPAAQERVRRALRNFIDRYLSEQGIVKQIVGRLIITERTLSQTVQALERGGATEIAALLRESLIQQRAAAAVNEAIEDLLQRPVQSIFGDMTDDELARLQTVLTERVVEFARHGTTETFVIRRLEGFLEASEGKTLGEIAGYVGPRAGGRVRERLMEWIVDAARGPRAASLLETALVHRTEWLLSVPIGRIGDYLPPDGLDRAERVLFDPLWELLQSRVPALVAQLPIAEMVQERIRTYPIPDFERLIWSVTRRELRLIIYLGGFLGALVGSLTVTLQAPPVGLAYIGTILLVSYFFLNLR